MWPYQESQVGPLRDQGQESVGPFSGKYGMVRFDELTASVWRHQVRTWHKQNSPDQTFAAPSKLSFQSQTSQSNDRQLLMFSCHEAVEAGGRLRNSTPLGNNLINQILSRENFDLIFRSAPTLAHLGKLNSNEEVLDAVTVTCKLKRSRPIDRSLVFRGPESQPPLLLGAEFFTPAPFS